MNNRQKDQHILVQVFGFGLLLTIVASLFILMIIVSVA